MSKAEKEHLDVMVKELDEKFDGFWKLHVERTSSVNEEYYIAIHENTNSFCIYISKGQININFTQPTYFEVIKKAHDYFIVKGGEL